MTFIDQVQAHPAYKRFSSLLAKHEVAESDLIAAVYISVMESVGGMVPGVQYTTEDLCGKIVWNQWPTKGQHRAMGICLSFLVAEQLVPLVRTSPAHKRNKRYSLKLANA